MKDKIRLEVMKVFDQEANVDTVVDNILLLLGVNESVCPIPEHHELELKLMGKCSACGEKQAN